MDIDKALLVDLRPQLLECDRSLDLRVAREIMGIEPEQATDQTAWLFSVDRNCLLPGDWFFHLPGYGVVELPCYSGDLLAAWRVEERIVELGAEIQGRYTDALSIRTGHCLFASLHASARDRILAALTAVSMPPPILSH